MRSASRLRTAPALISLGLACAFLSSPRGARAAGNTPQDAARRSSPGDLDVEVERHQLDNGLVVLLAPDRQMPSVFVSMGFRAGALYEPPGRTGMAHLVEHLLATGTSSTSYAAEAERRGSRWFNATTSERVMTFDIGLPPEELRFGLWMMADRIGARPRALEPGLLEREREVVLVERGMRTIDRPFSVADLAIDQRAFPEGHPLHAGVIGRPDHLRAVTEADVDAFIASYLHASNAVLVVAGDFEPEPTLAWIEEELGTLPRGEVPERPRLEGPRRLKELAAKELWSHQPRVSVLWRLPELGVEQRTALELGAMLMASYLDGAFGSRLSARLLDLGTESIFRMDVVLPYDKPVAAARGEAEVFLRYLTAVDMPSTYYDAVRNLRDLFMMDQLATLRGRSRVLLELELEGEPVEHLSTVLGRQWSMQRHDVQHVAWKYLVVDGARMVFHARPIEPRQPKLDWELREQSE